MDIYSVLRRPLTIAHGHGPCTGPSSTDSPKMFPFSSSLVSASVEEIVGPLHTRDPLIQVLLVARPFLGPLMVAKFTLSAIMPSFKAAVSID